MADNVVVLAPRPKDAPTLRFVEVRLDVETYNLKMTVHDDLGKVVATLMYALASKPEDFDLGRLRIAWDGWRGSSTAAS